MSGLLVDDLFRGIAAMTVAWAVPTKPVEGAWSLWHRMMPIMLMERDVVRDYDGAKIWAIFFVLSDAFFRGQSVCIS